MIIRAAEEKDIGRILELLSQVLELHARIRPDIFIPGTTKYTEDELKEILADASRPVYAAITDEGELAGYAFCVLKSQPFATDMVPFDSVYIDDLCVDEKYRGQGVGRALFDYVKAEAKKRGCYEITLNVWEGNDGARAFYDALGMKPKETNMELIL